MENVTIAAGKLGCEAKIELFPDAAKEHLVATIDFKESASKIEPLFDAIAQRVTNRKHYDGSPLRDSEKEELLAVADPAVHLVLIETRTDVAKLARAASVNETMLVLNKHVHDFFFSHVRWTPEENEIQPERIYWITLELNAKQAKGFKAMRTWGVAHECLRSWSSRR